MDEVGLGDLIGRPANRGTGSRSDDSGVHASEETPRALPPVDDSSGVPQTAGVADLRVCACSSGLEESLHDVEGSGGGRGDTSGETTGGAVRERVVAGSSAALHDFGEGLVGGELQCRERHGHGQGGGVGSVEGTQALGLVDGARAFPDVAESRAVDLHTLLDNVEGVHESITGDRSACAA